MSRIAIEEQSLIDIADAIREGTGLTATMTSAEMVENIGTWDNVLDRLDNTDIQVGEVSDEISELRDEITAIDTTVSAFGNSVVNGIIGVTNLEEGGFTGANGKGANPLRIRLINPFYAPKGTELNFSIGNLYWMAWEMSSNSTTGGNVIVSTAWTQNMSYTVQNDCWLMMAFATGETSAASANITLADFDGKSVKIGNRGGNLGVSYPFSVDTTKMTGYLYTINASNKWVKSATSSTSRGACVKIPTHAVKVKITIPSGVSAILAFMKSFDENGEVANNGTPNFSTQRPSRINVTTGTYEYAIAEDEKYLYYLKTNSSGGDTSPSEIVFTLSTEMYSEQIFPYNIDNFVTGGISSTDGGNTTSSTRVRTNNYYMIDHVYLFLTDARHWFKVAYYDENRNFLGFSDWLREKIIRLTDFPGAVYYRLLFRNLKEDNDLTFSTFATSPKIIVTDNPMAFTAQTVFKADVPENIGVLNTIMRAKQCAEISYITMAVLPNQHGDYETGTTIKGIPYSSVRNESLYVPNCVSFDSFMTAALNPNSYLYTLTSTSPNSKTFMGTVCSSFVSYCLDLPCVYTTHQIGELPDVEYVENQNVSGLKLGDMLLKIDHHIGIVTDIYRDTKGRIKYVGVAEAEPPLVKRVVYTASSLASYFSPTSYHTYRYKKIYSVGYTSTQWVAVEDEKAVTPAYNKNLFPRRGDKANWRYGETVEIDVVNTSTEYTTYQLYKGTTQVATGNIENNLITLTGLEAGNYKIRVTDGSSYSDYALFSVVDVTVSVEDQGNKTAKISFSCSDNATPVWFAWCYNSGSDINAVEEACSLTAEDIQNGFVISEFASGTWRFKVEVQTDYGTYSSDLVAATITA